MPIKSYVHQGELSPDQEKTYVHLPFEMPPNAVRVEVAFSYSNQISSNPLLSGGNTIDLGVFDERGIEFLKAGFRGASGSERKTFFISETEATPGYLAGPLNPGQWNVMLGLYKIAEEGCEFRVDIQVETQPGHQPIRQNDKASGDLPASAPAAAAAPWLRGELHCHTWHSDGELSAVDLVKLAHSRGLDFLAIADHNTTASQHEQENMVDPGLILIRGVEATTFKGHFNAWGIPDWVDFRVHQPEDMEAALRFANDHGALTSCGHPKPFGPDWEYPQVTNHACVEVWNGPWTGMNEISLEYWLTLLGAGRRKVAVGGSDYHRTGEGDGLWMRELGTPTNWVYVPGTPTAASILEAIRAGHVSLSDTPDGPLIELWGGQDYTAMGGDEAALPEHGRLPVRIRVRRGAGFELKLLDQRGELHTQRVTAQDEQIEWEGKVSGSRYVRVELRDEEGRLRGMTNPIYLAQAS